MRTLRHPTRMAVALLVAASLVAGAAPGPHPAASAETPCTGRRCGMSGDNTGSGYSAAAAYATARGEASDGTRETCEVNPGQPGYYVVHSHGGPDTYYVFIHCFDNSITDPSSHPDSGLDRVIDLYVVEAMDPQDLVEQALASLQVPAPVITTSPGGGNPSLVGIETWLMVESASWGPVMETDTQGILSVTVWATPRDDGNVVWDTGEGTVTCQGNGQPPGSCAYTYATSSALQPAATDVGPAYEVTASITYTGGYSVSVGGQAVGGDPDLGDIVRTSEPVYLPVAEAQAINTFWTP